MSHITPRSKPLLTRVRRIKGQSEALEAALQQGGDCLAVLQQIAAIRGAVNGLMQQVLADHVRAHLGDNALSPEQRAEEVEQLLGILQSYLK